MLFFSLIDFFFFFFFFFSLSLSLSLSLSRSLSLSLSQSGNLKVSVYEAAAHGTVAILAPLLRQFLARGKVPTYHQHARHI
jgi:hypothetical protein